MRCAVVLEPHIWIITAVPSIGGACFMAACIRPFVVGYFQRRRALRDTENDEDSDSEDVVVAPAGNPPAIDAG